MTTHITPFSVKSELAWAKLTNRLTAAHGAVVLKTETIEIPKPTGFQKFNDFMSGTKKKYIPEIIKHGAIAESTILLDGRYDPEELAIQIKNCLPADEFTSLVEVDEECCETRMWEIRPHAIRCTTFEK